MYALLTRALLICNMHKHFKSLSFDVLLVPLKKGPLGRIVGVLFCSCVPLVSDGDETRLGALCDSVMVYFEYTFYIFLFYIVLIII